MRAPCPGSRPSLLGLCAALALGSCATPSPGVPDPFADPDLHPTETTAEESREIRPDPAPADTPYVVVLGTAQDAGLPQIGANSEYDRAAWANRSLRRAPASLLLVDPLAKKRWLIDATPQIRLQVERAEEYPPQRERTSGRPPLFDGIFLTHAHMGHVAGLLQLGREAYAAEGQVVYASTSVREFLLDNAPWNLLVSQGHIDLKPIAPGIPVQLTEQLSILPIAVPHRAELSKTLAFEINAPEETLLYMPDIDSLDEWDRDFVAELKRVDTFLLDGTFFSANELPDRDLAEIPHPLIVDTLERVAELPAEVVARLVFTHLNHSNPAVDPESGAAKVIRGAGARVAREGEVIPLGK